MSCLQITACRLICSPSASPVPSSQLNKAFTTPSIYLRTKAKPPKLPLNLTSATSRYQRATTVCLFGGKGNPDNGNEGSPWKAIENAVGNLKKEPSVEELLRQQIQKNEFYDDGGSSGKPPGGGDGGGGGGGGFSEAEDGGLAGMWDEFSQVILATMGFIFLYIYIIEGEEITVLAKDLLRFLFKRQMSIRLRRLVEEWQDFFQSMKDKPAYDPYWLEREILSTTTCYDSPAKYVYMANTLIQSESTSDQRESHFDQLEPTSDQPESKFDDYEDDEQY
ncbi:uncharacterized protein LOC121758819 [Salvia splendens]|uniref:uncharacterized protein LOC121758819 n=1 Tax=Salvia splendens TaxID=180675 RepID=UPI001C264069|nr:uncharacterized protein LOC121758819 [Salvia splendens]XP_042010162.1 uncharacterized protein LOC121758819 [Salvia splendens]